MPASRLKEDDPGEARYADVLSPERPWPEKPSRYGSHHDGDASGENAGGPGANSPQVPSRLPDFEEKSGFEFGFLNADVGSNPREEAREMVLELQPRKEAVRSGAPPPRSR